MIEPPQTYAQNNFFQGSVVSEIPPKPSLAGRRGIRALRQFVKKINSAFIVVLLITLYFPTIGMCFAIYKLLKLFEKKKNSDSYWLEPQSGKFDKDYFKSAY